MYEYEVPRGLSRLPLARLLILDRDLVILPSKIPIFRRRLVLHGSNFHVLRIQSAKAVEVTVIAPPCPRPGVQSLASHVMPT